MHNDLWHHASKEKPEQAQCKPEASPVVPVLHHIQTIALEIDFSVEIHLMKGLHGDLVLSVILIFVFLVVESKILFNRLAWELRLLINARRKGRENGPESHEDRNGKENNEENPSLQSTSQFPRNVQRDSAQQEEENIVVEAFSAGRVSGEGSVLD